MEPFISQEVLLSTLEVLLLFQDQMVKQEQMMIQLSTLIVQLSQETTEVLHYLEEEQLQHQMVI